MKNDEKTSNLRNGCQFAIDRIGDRKEEISSDQIDKNYTRFEKRLRKPPKELAPFQSLIDTILKSEDKYRIFWLSMKLQAIYLGTGNKGVALLPGLWEDEADLVDICQIHLLKIYRSVGPLDEFLYFQSSVLEAILPRLEVPVMTSSICPDTENTMMKLLDAKFPNGTPVIKKFDWI